MRKLGGALSVGRRLAWLSTLLGGLSVQAQFGFFDTGLNLELPDGGGTGVIVQREVSGLSQAVRTVTVRLDISGNWTGDLYAYLHFDGAHAVLLNRPGTTAANRVGYGDPGLRIRLSDDAPNGDIHTYRLTLSGNPEQGLTESLTGDWAPDGRTTDPDAVRDTNPRTALLGTFTGMIPNGTWTLFVADLAPGSVHYLDAWGLELTMVPEPANALFLTGMGCLLWAAFARRVTSSLTPSLPSDLPAEASAQTGGRGCSAAAGRVMETVSVSGA